MEDVRIARLPFDSPVPVGSISQDGASFAYDASYLARPDAVPLSLSLPLRKEPFDAAAFRPYFEGLLAEGAARQALASALQISEDDYLGLLVACGRECVGDVLAGTAQSPWLDEPPGYDRIAPGELDGMFGDLPGSASENAASRLSLAGTQSKVGLALARPGDRSAGWLRPRGLAATTHILKTSYLRDLPEIEYLCTCAARACGIAVPECFLLDLPRPVLAVERFDRSARVRGGALAVERLHQEDLAQAFGVASASKYAELPGGSVAAIASLIRHGSVRPAHDLGQFALTLLFSYVIGNCDCHLKNFSIRLRPPRPGRPTFFELSPSYDLVSTTRYPRFSRDMAMGLGGVRDIDEVSPDVLSKVAEDLGVSAAALKRLGERIAARVVKAIQDAGNGASGPVLESTPYVADDLVEEMAPRLSTLEAFCAA